MFSKSCFFLFHLKLPFTYVMMQFVHNYYYYLGNIQTSVIDTRSYRSYQYIESDFRF